MGLHALFDYLNQRLHALVAVLGIPGLSPRLRQRGLGFLQPQAVVRRSNGADVLVTDEVAAGVAGRGGGGR